MKRVFDQAFGASWAAVTGAAGETGKRTNMEPKASAESKGVVVPLASAVPVRGHLPDKGNDQAHAELKDADPEVPHIPDPSEATTDEEEVEASLVVVDPAPAAGPPRPVPDGDAAGGPAPAPESDSDSWEFLESPVGHASNRPVLLRLRRSFF